MKQSNLLGAIVLLSWLGCTNDYDAFPTEEESSSATSTGAAPSSGSAPSTTTGSSDTVASAAVTTSGSGGSVQGGASATGSGGDATGSGGDGGDGGAVSTGSGGSGGVGDGSGGATGTGGDGGATSTGGGGQAGTGGAGGEGGGAPCVDVEGSCEPWFDAAWTRRRRIQIDNTGVVAQVADFPLLVSLDADRIDYAATLPGGTDLRFVADDGTTVLAHDVEAWTPGGTSSVWVKIPLIPAGGGGRVTFWMYHGNVAAAAPGPASATWTAGFTSVHHFNTTFVDATGSGHDGVVTTGPTAAVGRVAGGMNFDGVDDRVLLPDEADYDFTTSMSVTAWVRVETFTKAWQAMVAKGDGAWRVHRDNTANKLDFGTSHTANPNDNYAGTTDLLPPAWHHVAVTYDGATKAVYVDGVLEASKAFTLPIATTDLQVCIGENNQATNRHFDGDIDEVRIAGVTRSGAWIGLEHRTVTDPTLLLFSAEQVAP